MGVHLVVLQLLAQCSLCTLLMIPIIPSLVNGSSVGGVVPSPFTLAQILLAKALGDGSPRPHSWDTSCVARMFTKSSPLFLRPGAGDRLAVLGLQKTYYVGGRVMHSGEGPSSGELLWWH